MLEWHQKMMTFKQSTPDSTFDLTLTITKNWMHIQFAFVLLFDECSHSISKNTSSKTNVNWMHIRLTFILRFLFFEIKYEYSFYFLLDL